METSTFWTYAEKHPDKTLLVTPEGQEIRAGELLRGANQVVHALRALGLSRGDSLAVIMPNCAAFVELFMAAAQAGLYLTPVNWHLTAPEIAYIVKDSEAKAVFTSPRFVDNVTKALDAASFPAEGRLCVSAEPVAGYRSYEAFKAPHPGDTPPERFAGGPMTYTSGTTGNPKGVRRPLPPVAPELVAGQQALFLALFGMLPGSEGVHLVVAPLYHTAVINFATNHLHLGHKVVLMEKWGPEETLQLIEQQRVTNSHMVPTMFNRLLKLPDEVKRKYDLSSLSHIIHSAAPCPVETKRAMLDWWGPCIYEYYAASEGGGTLATPQDWQKKPGTVGKPWPISQIRILDDDQQPVEAGTVGTVWIRMGDHKFAYHKDEKKTDDAWHEGFFTVGDAGYLDEDGYLFLCDRKADMIISGGVNIYPAEIESVFILHPKVADVAIFGVPDEDWGEQVKAVIQPAAGEAPGEALEVALLDYAKDKLAKYKWPKSIDFVTEMPRDPNGKLYKRKLRDPYWAGRDKAI